MRKFPIIVLLALSITGVASAASDQSSAVRKLEVQITEPTDGGFVFGKARIAAEVEVPEELGKVRVEFSISGKLIYIDREPPYEVFHNFGAQPRSWVIEAVAVSGDGDTARATIVTRKLVINYHEIVERVVITASVTDKKRMFVPGITQDQFLLYEDDVLQKLMEFSMETRPITMAILIDSSGSMREELGQVQDAAEAFVDTLRPVDRALIIDFDENVYLLQELTSDHDLLGKAIRSTDAEGGTALYDAIVAAYRKLSTIDGRKAIVLLTDGADTNSRVSYQKTLERTRTNDLVIYSIGLGSTVLDVGVRGSLKQVADETGGRSFFPSKASDLKGVYQQIAQDLRSRYYFAYSSSNQTWDGSWRKISLKSEVKGVKIKTRKGYYAVQN